MFATLSIKRTANKVCYCKGDQCGKQISVGDDIWWGATSSQTKRDGPMGPFCSKECHDTVEWRIQKSDEEFNETRWC